MSPDSNPNDPTENGRDGLPTKTESGQAAHSGPEMSNPVFNRWPSIVFAVGCGGLLAGLALPGFFASLTLSPADNVVARLENGERVVTAELGAAELARKRSLVFRDSARTWTELGAIYYERARRLGRRHQGYNVFLDRSIGAYRRGLARAPAQPEAWAYLASAELARHGAQSELGPALRMAIKLAPDNSNLLKMRIEIGLAAWWRLDDETREKVAQQAVAGIDADPRGMAQLVTRRGTLNIIGEILQDDPTRLQRFEAALSSRD